jgi:hypothetical protein
MPASIDIRDMLRRLGEAQRRGEAAAERAVDQFGEHVLGEAQLLAPQSPSQQFVPGIRKPQIQNPKWTGHSGALRDSATSEPVQNRNGLITKVIGFNTVYAARQHEELDYQHTNGQAKYLETALRRNTPKMAEFVGDRVRRAMEGQG